SWARMIRYLGEQYGRIGEYARPWQHRRGQAAEDLMGFAIARREPHDAEPDAASCGERLPAAEPADVLVVGRQHLVSRRQLEAVGDPAHGLGGVAREDETVRIAVQQPSEPLLEALPRHARRVRLCDLARATLHGFDHRQGLRPERAHVEVDAARGDEEPVADAAPVRL